MDGSGELLAERGLFAAAGLTLVALVGVPIVVCGTGAAALLGSGGARPGTLLAAAWSPGTTHALWVPLLGSLAVAAGASLLAVPVGVGAATWIGWFAPARWRRRIRLGIGSFGSVPNVVFGFVGLAWVAPALARLAGVQDGRGWLAASLVLAALALPTVAAHADQAMRSVPRRRIDAALALGASREQGVRLVLWPEAWRGIFGAGLLGVVRTLGDTMVVLLLAGDALAGAGLLGPVRTLTSVLARGLPDPANASHRGALYVAAALLLLVAWAVSAFAGRIAREPADD